MRAARRGARAAPTQLKLVADLLVHDSPERQRKLAERDGLVGLVADLAEDFLGGAALAERDAVA